MTEQKERAGERASETVFYFLIGEILGIVFIMLESAILLANQ